MRKQQLMSVSYIAFIVALAVLLSGNQVFAGICLFIGIGLISVPVFSEPEVKVETTIIKELDLKGAIPHMVWTFERLEEARLNLRASRLEFDMLKKGLQINADGRPLALLIVKKGEYMLIGAKAPIYDFNDPRQGIILPPEKSSPGQELYRLLEEKGTIQ